MKTALEFADSQGLTYYMHDDEAWAGTEEEDRKLWQDFNELTGCDCSFSYWLENYGERLSDYLNDYHAIELASK